MKKGSGGRPQDIEHIFELEFVGGEEGRKLELAQARALRNLLLSISEHRLSHEPTEGSGSDTSK